MREDVQKWWKIAKRDLNSATYAVEFMDYSLTAFLCQQSVEKGLKALYIRKFNELKKTHDLFFLGRRVELPKKLLSICEELNSFYFITRYPDVSDEECSKEDAVHVIENAREVLKLDRKEYLISKLREFSRMASERIDITKMIFFGSMATGESHKDSDIDLIIVSQSFRKVSFWKRAIALYDYWDLDYPVDFLCFTPEEFEKKIRGVTIVSEAVKEGIEIT